MAISLLNWALKQTDVKGAAKCVLIVLANRADRTTRQCFPSLTEITDDAGVDRSTVTRCLLQLEATQKIHREKRGTKETVYTLQLGASRNQPLVAERTKCTPHLGAPCNYPDERKKSNQKKESTNNIPLILNNSNTLVSRPTKVPDDFAVTEEMRQWANGNGFDAKTVAQQTEAMIDHFRGSGKPKLNWVAVWRNWLRNSRGRFNANGNKLGQNKVDRTISNAREFGAEFCGENRSSSERGTEQSDHRDLRRTSEQTLFGKDPSRDDPHD